MYSMSNTWSCEILIARSAATGALPVSNKSVFLWSLARAVGRSLFSADGIAVALCLWRLRVPEKAPASFVPGPLSAKLGLGRGRADVRYVLPVVLGCRRTFYLCEKTSEIFLCKCAHHHSQV